MDRRILLAINAFLVLTTAVLSCRSFGPSPRSHEVLTVSEIDVVDRQGVTRVRIAGDLPPGVFHGKVIPRYQAAGVLLYDQTGQERGGYVTFSPGRQVALTLDNATSPAAAAMLIAGAEGGAALTLSHENDIAELRVDDETGPSIHAMRQNAVVFHEPPVHNFQATEGCKELRAAVGKLSSADVIAACRARVSEEACQACLSGLEHIAPPN